MKKITAFECEFCKRILKTKQAMKKHEPKCFKNPLSKSCITCNNLALKNCINGEPVSYDEELILQYKIEGTYNTFIGAMEADFNELKDEYKYLYDTYPENYCMANAVILNKLKTACTLHQQYPPFVKNILTERK